MNKKTLNNFFIVAFLSFLLVLMGLKVIAGSMLSLQNILLLLGFCVILGIVSTLFYSLHYKVAWHLFNAGILIGLFEMYRTFFANKNGWEDLAALATLFIWVLIGLCAGLIGQIVFYFYLKNKSRKRG